MKNDAPVNLSTSQVISDTFFVSAARIGTTLLKPIRGIILARLLGPEFYGVLSIPLPYVQIMTLLANIGFNTSIVKLAPDYLQKGRSDLARMIFRSTTVMTVLLSLLWTAILLVLSEWLAVDVSHRPDAVGPIRIFALIIPFMSLNAYYAAAFLAMQKGKLRAGLSVVYGLVDIVLPILAIFWKKDVTLVLGGFLAGEIFGTAIFAIYFQKRAIRGLAARAGSLVRGMKEVVSFGFLFFFATLGWNLINSVDRIMVKFYLPAEQLAFYSMAALIITALNIISATAGTALIPSLTAARTMGDKALFRKQIWNMTRLSLMAIVPVAGILYALAFDIFNVVLPKYTDSAPVLRILIFVGFIDILCRVAWASLVAYGRGGKAAFAYILAAVINIAFNALLIPRMGIAGAAFASLLSFVVLAAVLQVMMSSVAGVRTDPAVLIHPTILSLVFPALAFLLGGLGSLERSVIVTIAGGVIYIVLAAATGLIRREDLDKTRSILDARPPGMMRGIGLFVLSSIGRITRGK